MDIKPSTQPRLSIIIPVYNDAANLRVLLESIYANTFECFEVIVVDDASPHDDVRCVAGEFPARYVRHKQNRCVAATRNTGARYARADILVFFDSDVVIEKDTLQRFADAYDDPGVMYYQAINSKSPANQGFGPELVALRWYFLTYGLKKSSLHSLFFSIRKSVYFMYGGFDESFTTLGAEEYEFGQRLDKGIELRTDMSLQIKHNFQGVFKRALSVYKRSLGYSLMFIFRNRRFEYENATKQEVFSSFMAVAVFSAICIALQQLLFNNYVVLDMDVFALASSPLIYDAFLELNLPIADGSDLLLSDILVYEIDHLIFLGFAGLTYISANARFVIFLARNKGVLFTVEALPVVFLWSLATGLGIAAALIVAALRIATGKKYPSPQLVRCATSEQ